MPLLNSPNAKKKHTFSGQRVKRGLYKSGDGTLLNADTNGAYNILRKTNSDFSFSDLVEKVGNRIKRWFHPPHASSLWLKVTLSFGEGIMG
jgi:transposase